MERSIRVLTMVDAVLPRTTLWRQASLVALFSVLNGLAAQFRIDLPFTPIPITGHTFAVLVTGVLLGSRLGLVTMVAYVGEGVVGLPVFSGFKSGPLHLLGPTGGYILGFVIGAYVVGLLAERGWDRRPMTTALAMAIGNVVIYACGLVWFSRFFGLDRAVALSVLPFIPGDIVKLVLATVLLPTGWKLLGRWF